MERTSTVAGAENTVAAFPGDGRDWVDFCKSNLRFIVGYCILGLHRRAALALKRRDPRLLFRASQS